MAECMEIVDVKKVDVNHPINSVILLDENNKVACKFCSHIYPELHVGNIKKHVKRKHTKEFESLEKLTDDQKSNKQAKTAGLGRKISTENSISVIIDVDNIKLGLVEMCSRNLVPFKKLTNSGFLRIMEPIIQQARKCKISLSTSSEAVHEYSDAEYEKMLQFVSDELKGKIFSLMVDATTTQNRSIFGVAAQYIQNGQVVVRTLAMRRLKEDPDALYLSNVIKTVLFEYGVNAAYVYSITTDNEAAAKKCVRDTAASTTTVLEDYLMSDLDDGENLTRALEAARMIAEMDTENLSISSVRCATHTMELGVKDTIGTKQKRKLDDPCIKYVDTIKSVVSIVSKLRSSKMKIAMELEHLLMPVAFVEIRWSSANTMLQRMFTLQSFIEKLAETDHSFQLDWPLLHEIGPALDLVANCMTVLQKEDICLSDVYAQWLLLIDQLEELTTEYSKHLLQAIRRRFSNIFGSDCEPMLSCIWMDPRYQITLSLEHKKIARTHLMGVYERISKIEEIGTDPTERNENATDSRLEKLMKAYEERTKTTAKVICLRDILESFNDMERMSIDTNPRNYWNDRKMSAPQMYALAQVIFAVPGAQAAVERNFSALNQTLTKFRGRLSDETLERILFMRCNDLLFDRN